MKKKSSFQNRSTLISAVLTPVILGLLYLAAQMIPAGALSPSDQRDNVVPIDIEAFQPPAPPPPPPPPPPEAVQPEESRIVTIPVEEATVPVLEAEEPSDEPVEETTDITAVSSDPDGVAGGTGVAGGADPDLVISALVGLIEREKEYTDRAVQRGIEGTVIVEVTINTDCVVTDYSIISSDNSHLTDSIHETMEDVTGRDLSDETLEEPLTVSVPVEFVLI
ncbi:hypothetical protein CSA37_08795 [Candidatus Fermentibacteria bacterium]|nr:MAG: hypothetical protein CSA37_08795 [Candidatus Fermentibacteria bacterium]